MADAVIGGLILSTILSLFVVPAFYVVADRLKSRFHRPPAHQPPPPPAAVPTEGLDFFELHSKPPGSQEKYAGSPRENEGGNQKKTGDPWRPLEPWRGLFAQQPSRDARAWSMLEQAEN